MRARVGVAPVTRNVLWVHRSAPLHALLHDMLFESDNHYAEQLLRAVGEHDGAVGTERSGEVSERAALKRLGAPADGLRVIDGSGLAPADRIEALSLATLRLAELDPTGPNSLPTSPRRDRGDGSTCAT